RFLIWGLIGLDCHCFNLSSGTVANVERRCDLAFVSRPHFFLLGLCSSATTGGLNRLKVDRRLADVLIFEMADGLLVARRRMRLDIGLLPFQFGARAQAHDHRQGESKEWCFHLLE